MSLKIIVVYFAIAEITRVRQKLFHLNESVKKTENELPVPSGNIVSLQEKVFVPVKENPNVG